MLHGCYMYLPTVPTLVFLGHIYEVNTWPRYLQHLTADFLYWNKDWAKMKIIIVIHQVTYWHTGRFGRFMPLLVTICSGGCLYSTKIIDLIVCEDSWNFVHPSAGIAWIRIRLLLLLMFCVLCFSIDEIANPRIFDWKVFTICSPMLVGNFWKWIKVLKLNYHVIKSTPSVLIPKNIAKASTKWHATHTNSRPNMFHLNFVLIFFTFGKTRISWCSHLCLPCFFWKHKIYYVQDTKVAIHSAIS